MAHRNSGKITKMKKSFAISDIVDFAKNHINKWTVRIVIGILIIILAIIGFVIYKRYTSYDDYKVLNSIKVESSSDSKYLSYMDFVVKYNGDGLSYIDDEGTVWNETFQMKSPIIDVCDSYIAVADKNSNDIYIFNEILHRF